MSTSLPLARGDSQLAHILAREDLQEASAASPAPSLHRAGTRGATRAKNDGRAALAMVRALPAHRVLVLDVVRPTGSRARWAALYLEVTPEGYWLHLIRRQAGCTEHAKVAGMTVHGVARTFERVLGRNDLDAVEQMVGVALRCAFASRPIFSDKIGMNFELYVGALPMMFLGTVDEKGRLVIKTVVAKGMLRREQLDRMADVAPEGYACFGVD